MRRNMKTFELLAAAGLALALTVGAAMAEDSATPPAATPPAGTPPAAAAAPATAVPAPTPAQRPGATPATDAPATGAPAPEAKAETPDPAGQGTGWNAEVATPGGGIVLSDAQTTLVKTVNTYFNALGDLKGDFVQTTADNKRMKGKFMVKRPGRFRFDYSRPSRQIIISDGEYLAIQDLDLNNEDRVSLDQTPFRLLLRKDVDLIRDAQIVELQESDDLIVLALSDKSPDAPGKIKLFLSTKPQVELKEWVTTDAQGLDTRVELSSLTKAETLDAKLFKIEAVSLNNFHP
jgi:outer membrane lipoprotein-sorting protein